MTNNKDLSLASKYNMALSMTPKLISFKIICCANFNTFEVIYKYNNISTSVNTLKIYISSLKYSATIQFSVF